MENDITPIKFSSSSKPSILLGDSHCPSSYRHAEKSVTSVELQDRSFCSKLRGILLFTLIIVYYTAQCLAVKVVMLRYSISSQEVLYYMSVVGTVCFALYAQKQGFDLLVFPARLRWVMFWRVVTGSVMDVALYMAF